LCFSTIRDQQGEEEGSESEKEGEGEGEEREKMGIEETATEFESRYYNIAKIAFSNGCSSWIRSVLKQIEEASSSSKSIQKLLKSSDATVRARLESWAMHYGVNSFVSQLESDTVVDTLREISPQDSYDSDVENRTKLAGTIAKVCLVNVVAIQLISQ